MKHPIVLIEWIDATSRDHWESLSEKLTPNTILSCGFLIDQTEKYYTLAVNVDLDADTCSCSMTIPKGMVVKVKTIKKA